MMTLKVVNERSQAVLDAAYGDAPNDGVTAFAVLLVAFVTQASVLGDEGALLSIVQKIVGDKE